MTEQNPFKWRHFQAEIILLCALVFAAHSATNNHTREYDFGPLVTIANVH